MTTIAMVEVPPLAAIEPAKLQVTVPTGDVPELGVQVQPVPVADTKSSPAGTASKTLAVVAAAVPLLVVVIV